MAEEATRVTSQQGFLNPPQSDGDKIWVEFNSGEKQVLSEMLQTMRSLKAELQRYKADNETIIQAQEQQHE